MGPVRGPRGQVRVRVRGHGVRPAEEALRPGGRLRGRRRLEDDQAQRGQAQEERPQRRRVPRPHAVGRQRGRGVGPRRRVRGRPRPDQGARGREGRPLALEAAALQVPAQARARLRREDAHRPQEGQLDPGALVLDRVDKVRGGGRQRRARLLRRRGQAGCGGEGEARGARRGRGPQAQV